MINDDILYRIMQIIIGVPSVSDDMVEHENETLRDRVSDLEKRVHDQNDEITCLRATLADALRRINTLEAGKGKEYSAQYEGKG